MDVIPLTQPISGRVVYSVDDQAFDFIPNDPGEVAARRRSPAWLAVDTVFVDIGMPNVILLSRGGVVDPFRCGYGLVPHHERRTR